MHRQSRAATYSRQAVRTVASGVGIAAAGYAAYAGAAWLRYGRVPDGDADASDPLLDRYMPVYEVVERHHVRVAAPARITLEAAREQPLMGIPIVRAIFKARELILGATATPVAPQGLLQETLSLGWGVLAEVPDREIVVGSVTKPWEANVVFTALAPQDFAAFAKRGHVKIVWSLRADPIDGDHCVFRTETRALATDAMARARFRRYWAFVSPGVALIRRLSVASVKCAAERRACVAAEPQSTPSK